MKEDTRNDARAEPTGQDVAAGTFYGTMLVAGILFFVIGLAFPPALIVTAACVLASLGGHEAESHKAAMEEAKDAPLDLAERSHGCGRSVLLALAIAAVCFVALLGLGTR